MNNNRPLILLVEDNENDVEFVRRAFKKNNLDKCLKRVGNGQEALELIFALPEEEDVDLDPNYPQIILLDLNMPKLNGFEVLRALKAEPKSKSICIIILTTSNASPDIKTCFELGASSYIVKPFDFDKFLHAVRAFGYGFLEQRASA